jgi:hypothetical protein
VRRQPQVSWNRWRRRQEQQFQKLIQHQQQPHQQLTRKLVLKARVPLAPALAI